MNGTKFEYKASKLNDFLGLLAMGAAALSISISFAYQDPPLGQSEQTETFSEEMQVRVVDRVSCINGVQKISANWS